LEQLGGRVFVEHRRTLRVIRELLLRDVPPLSAAAEPDEQQWSSVLVALLARQRFEDAF